MMCYAQSVRAAPLSLWQMTQRRYNKVINESRCLTACGNILAHGQFVERLFSIYYE